MSQKYDKYLQNHKENVFKAFKWIKENISEIFDEEILEYTEYNCIYGHDLSKFSLDEYNAYDLYFYGNNRSLEVIEEFNKAWLLHIHRNPHHWQYWVLIGDESGIKALDIPYEYIIEMFLDHWSFSWKEGNLFEIKNWYDSHKDIIIFSENTKRLYENILFTVLDLLNEGSIS